MFCPLQHSLKVLKFLIRTFKSIFYTAFCNTEIAETNVKFSEFS